LYGRKARRAVCGGARVDDILIVNVFTIFPGIATGTAKRTGIKNRAASRLAFRMAGNTTETLVAKPFSPTGTLASASAHPPSSATPFIIHSCHSPPLT
jgi:hypothetical protein